MSNEVVIDITDALSPDEAAAQPETGRERRKRIERERAIRELDENPILLEEAEAIVAKAAQLCRRRNRSKKQRIPQWLRWAIWERDDFRCAVCGQRRFLTIDHVVPESRGGTIDPDNLLTLCRTCNVGKGTKSLENYIGSLVIRNFRMWEFLFGSHTPGAIDGNVADPAVDD